jgi:hypothetical protein
MKLVERKLKKIYESSSINPLLKDYIGKKIKKNIEKKYLDQPRLTSQTQVWKL